jgi:hypothetical protein
VSDLLQLANLLRQRTDDQLVSLLHRRTVVGLSKDFFDLAQSLLTPKSVNQALSRLSASEVAALRALVAGQPADPMVLGALADMALVVETPGGHTALEAVVTQLAAIPQKQNAAAYMNAAKARNAAAMATGMGNSSLLLAEPAAPLETEVVLGLAAIAAFETQLALTELVLDVEQHLIKQIGKSGFGVGDVKRLSSHLGKNNATVRGYYLLAQQLQLVQLLGERWYLTPSAQSFLDSSVMDRWLLIATQWVRSLGPTGAKEMLDLELGAGDAGNVSASVESGESGASEQVAVTLDSALERVFPLADESLGNELSLLKQQAQDIGFSVSGKATPLLVPCLKGDFASAKALLEAHLPSAQHSLIVQADLSLIAPGPLDTSTESTVRKFAQIEQVSVACSYRLSALSVSHGLECGLSIDEIRNTLLDLSQKPLPQPVEYLLTEAQNRFGRLAISKGLGLDRAILKSTDGIHLTEVLNDVRLRPFAFQPVTASSIATRFEPDVLYFALRDNGYVPVRVDESGAVISPRAKHSWSAESLLVEHDPLADLIAKLRAADQKVGSQPDDQDLVRQIQLAVKNKAQLLVTLMSRDGSEVEFTVIPTALANGRLRGLDKKADIERTLPLEKILKVTF